MTAHNPKRTKLYQTRILPKIENLKLAYAILDYDKDYEIQNLTMTARNPKRTKLYQTRILPGSKT